MSREDEEEDVIDLPPELLLPLLPDLALLLTQLAAHHPAAAGQGGTIQRNLVGFLATLHGQVVGLAFCLNFLARGISKVGCMGLCPTLHW